MKPVKLLHITGDSCFGGAGRIIIRLGQLARSEGWQVDVLTTDATFQRALRKNGLGIVDLDVIRRDIHAGWDLVGLARLRKFLADEGYGVVHTHTSKAGFVGRLAGKLARVPVIIHTAHGFAFHERSRRSSRLFYTTLERIAARWCDRIVSVSEFHRRWAIELGICQPPHILAIPNGIADLPAPTIEPAEMRQRLGVRDGDLMVLTMARLAPDKGIEYLVEASAMLSVISRRFRFVIAGDGPQRAHLEQCARSWGAPECVDFLGFRNDVSELLAACDLVVLPSLREGLSIALLEAMAAGKPIIATGIGSHREIVSASPMARLVPPADARALWQAILETTRDPVMMARLGTKARDLFEQQYTETRMVEAYRHLYRELIREKRLVPNTGAEYTYAAVPQLDSSAPTPKGNA